MQKLVLKRCVKCGDERKCKPRVLRCRVPKFGKGSFACYGRLEVVAKDAPVKQPRRPQDIAKRKLQQTERTIDDVQDEMLRLAARMGKLAKRQKSLGADARRYALTAAMTDDEYEAQRQRQHERQVKREASKVDRHIDLDDD